MLTNLFFESNFKFDLIKNYVNIYFCHRYIVTISPPKGPIALMAICFEIFNFNLGLVDDFVQPGLEMYFNS